ncbi:hypothetical protein CHARACLAT_015611 [Characodon lateralis]|uniref:Uncharacterized protein n=1 Tax=Characodon lateralis TaxID=208331 RepID=A0ABU7EBA8_9TELE|nr:hypothetical protein [Characodon lateralis]
MLTCYLSVSSFFRMEIILCVVMKTSQQNQIWLQSRRRSPRRLRKPLQVDHLAAEIPQGASPASSWVDHTSPSPNLLSSRNSSVWFSLKNKNRLMLQEPSKVQQTPSSSSISPSALF